MESGATPLHGLMSDHDQANWEPDLFNALLERGADINVNNGDGKSPVELLGGSRWLFDDVGLLRATPVPSKPYAPTMGSVRRRGRGG